MRDSELCEVLPAPTEMYKLLKHLMFQQQQANEKIKHLETIIRSRRIVILANTPIPTLTFQEWVNNIPVKVAHLHQVFQFDLYDGVKKCLEDYIDQTGLDTIPLRATPERSNTLYIYSLDSQKWVICDANEFTFLVEFLFNQFMSVYCEWEDENMALLESTQENKDNRVLYMLKITGSGLTHRERRRQELKSWLYKKVLYK
jgi:hypothetical protein